MSTNMWERNAKSMIISEHLGAVEPAMSVCSGVLQINQCIGHICDNNRFYYMRSRSSSSSSSSSSSVLSSLLNHYCQLSLLLQKAAWCGAISAVNHVCNVCAFCFWESWEKQSKQQQRPVGKGLRPKVCPKALFVFFVFRGFVVSTFLEGTSACPNLWFTWLSSQMCQIYWGYPLLPFFRKLHCTVGLLEPMIVNRSLVIWRKKKA